MQLAYGHPDAHHINAINVSKSLLSPRALIHEPGLPAWHSNQQSQPPKNPGYQLIFMSPMGGGRGVLELGDWEKKPHRDHRELGGDSFGKVQLGSH